MKKIYMFLMGLVLLLMPIMVNAEITYENGKFTTDNEDIFGLKYMLYDLNGRGYGTTTIKGNGDFGELNSFLSYFCDSDNFLCGNNINFKMYIMETDSNYKDIDNTQKYYAFNYNNGIFTELELVSFNFELNGGKFEPKKSKCDSAWYNIHLSHIKNIGEEHSSLSSTLSSCYENNGMPVKENYQFDGWFTDPNFETPFNYTYTDDFVMDRDITLYAKWKEIEEYTVKFETFGGTIIPDMVVKSNERISLPIPKKDGYTFIDWYYDENFEKIVDEIKSDSKLYARFVENSKKLTRIPLYVKAPVVGDKITVSEEEGYNESGIPVGQVILQNPTPIVESLDDRFEISLTDYYSELGYLFEGTIEENKDYYISIVFGLTDEAIKEGYYLGEEEDLIMVVNGKEEKLDTSLAFGSCNGWCPSAVHTIKIRSTNQRYGIIDGANQNIDGINDLVIRADGEIDNIKEIQLDGNVLDKMHYELTKGSTILTIKKDYLSSLDNGEHKVKFVYNDGEVETSFNMNKNTLENTVENLEVINNNNNNSIQEVKKTNNPMTKDVVARSIIMLMVFMIAGAIGIGYHNSLLKKYNK